jgi:hypothetical protein
MIYAEMIPTRSADELIEDFAKPIAEPGSIVGTAMQAALQVRIAEMQREAGHDALTWAKVAALATATATLIALTALLVAVL